MQDTPYLIGNSRGGVNGWVGRAAIFGVATPVEAFRYVAAGSAAGGQEHERAVIEQLIWRLRTIAKLRARGIGPEEVADLVDRDNYAVDVKPEYPDQIRITGSTSTGRWLTIALEDMGSGAYRPITGWKATEGEIRQYFGETQ